MATRGVPPREETLYIRSLSDSLTTAEVIQTCQRKGFSVSAKDVWNARRLPREAARKASAPKRVPREVSTAFIREQSLSLPSEVVIARAAAQGMLIDKRMVGGVRRGMKNELAAGVRPVGKARSASRPAPVPLQQRTAPDSAAPAVQAAQPRSGMAEALETELRSLVMQLGYHRVRSICNAIMQEAV
jgi:hypothetical protein